MGNIYALLGDGAAVISCVELFCQLSSGCAKSIPLFILMVQHIVRQYLTHVYLDNA